jgi:hypothetical protein
MANQPANTTAQNPTASTQANMVNPNRVVEEKLQLFKHTTGKEGNPYITLACIYGVDRFEIQDAAMYYDMQQFLNDVLHYNKYPVTAEGWGQFFRCVGNQPAVLWQLFSERKHLDDIPLYVGQGKYHWIRLLGPALELRTLPAYNNPRKRSRYHEHPLDNELRNVKATIRSSAAANPSVCASM